MKLSYRTPASLRPDSETRNARRFSGLDGLRGIAVSVVLVFHFFPHVLPGGFVGVDVFFVISGFLITGLLVDEYARSGRVSLRQFWARRVRRLVPPLVPLVLLCCTVAWMLGGDVLVGLGWQVLGAATFGYNWASIAGSASYFSATSPELFRNLWSLAVEEQFYLVWPFALIALMLVRNTRFRLVLVCALGLGSVLWMGFLFQPGADPTRVYYGSDTHSFGLFAGAALALVLRRRNGLGLGVNGGGVGDGGVGLGAGPRWALLVRLRPWLGLAALAGIGAAAAWLPAEGPLAYRGGLAFISVMSATVIWAAVCGARFGRWLDTPVLRWVGERSYGIYLWHWPIFVLAGVAWPSPGIGGELLVAAFAVLVAAASYRWLEQPVRRRGLRASIRSLSGFATRSWPRLGIVAVAAMLGLTLVGGTAAAIVVAPAETSAQAQITRGRQILDAAQAERRREDAERKSNPPESPAPATATQGDLITAVGDSVMLASAPELEARFPGILIDAAVSRGMKAAPDLLTAQASAGTLRPVVVVGLGTNGPITTDELLAIEAAIGPDRKLVLVTAFADRDWTAGVNTALTGFAAQHRLVGVANWHDAIAPHTDVLAGDNIHPGPTGGRIYADCIASALDWLAPQHPFHGRNPYRLGPDPLVLRPPA